MDRSDITPALAARLVAAQFPEWADLPIVPVERPGWDNITLRLGRELSVRLPSDDGYVPQVEKEHRWLPALAPHLGVRIPTPLAKGRPSDDFPRPWSVYSWIEAEPPNIAAIADLRVFAADVATFLRELHAIDAADGPPAGAHSFHRGGTLAVYDAETREAIELLADTIDVRAANALWNAALASPWAHAPVWVHGDLVTSNMLMRNGKQHAVIDFGCAAVGDPACDLVMAWTFFDRESREIFRRGLPLDDATWERGRAWALWKALTLANDKRGREDAEALRRRFGWRESAAQIIATVVAEPR